MAASVFLDGTTEINGDYIYKLTYKFQCYDDHFFLGATPCREVHIDIDKQGISTQPTFFLIKEGTTNVGKVFVDDVDDSNDYYYSYTCLDAMVQLNTDMIFTEDTVYNLVVAIQNRHGMTATPSGISSSTYPGRMTVSWSDYCTEREFISYVAELTGQIAYISRAGDRITFAECYTTWSGNSTEANHELDGDRISDLTVGLLHTYTKVVYDNVAHYEYGTNTGETLYINPNNILFADNNGDSTYNTIEKQVNRCGQLVIEAAQNLGNGFQFWNLKATDIVVPTGFVTGQPGRRLKTAITGWPQYWTFIEPNYTYSNGNWLGGINVNLKSVEQQETEVIDNTTKREINAVNIKIDRQAGTIDLLGQRVDDTEETLVHFQVNSSAGEVRVTNQTTNPPTSYTAFKGDGMRVYVDGQLVAEATASRFECDKGLGVQDWSIEHGSDAAVLMIYRRQ